MQKHEPEKHEPEEMVIEEMQVFKDAGVTKEHVMMQCAAEYAEGLEYVSPKRQTFRDRLKLYNNQRKKRDKVGILSLYNVMNTLLAVSYTDELSVAFGGKGFSGTDIAENTERLAKSDNEDMNMDVINYLTQWDRFFFGVGIRTVHGFDEDSQTPIVESLDPLTWVPDPQGSLAPNSYRFHCFEVEMIKSNMTADRGFFNVECLKPAPMPDDETQQTKDAYREAQNLDSGLRNQIRLEDYGGCVYNLVNCYTTIKDKKYLVTMSQDCTEIVRFERIEPVFLKEKANEMFNEWGIVLNFYSPQRNDPFGTSVADLVEDKQRAKSVLANLQLSLIKAQLYPMYLYNREKILNRRDLDFSFNKMIGVRGDVSGAVEVMNKAPTQFADTHNVSQMLEREQSLSTGADSMQSGVTNDTSRPLGESQLVQANANLRFALGSRINNWGEKQFWKLWYRCYVEFFDKAEQKMIEVTSAFGVQSITLYGNQFLVEKSPRIIITSKIESLAKLQHERTEFAAVAPLILQDPTTPQASKKYTQRHLLKLHGIPREQIALMVPPTPDEMAAHEENELLGRNMTVKLTIEEDHLSHMAIHMAAPDSNAKKAHIHAHKLAYIQSGQAENDRRRIEASAGAKEAQAAQAQNMIGAMNASQNSQRPSNQPVNNRQPMMAGV